VTYNKTHRPETHLVAEGDSELFAALFTGLNSNELLADPYLIHTLIIFITDFDILFSIALVADVKYEPDSVQFRI
jgi:hypothetical protein